MIHESCYWKDDLIELSKKINKKYIKLKGECDEQHLIDFEKDIMIATYSIRKLLEAGKISDNIANMKIGVHIYKAKRIVHKMNWHQIDENYETNYRRSKKYLRTICNLIIHSYCFIPRFDKNDTLRYLYFNSAKQKDIEIYSIDLIEFARVLEKVGSDYPNRGSFTYNEEKADYEFSSETIYTPAWVLYPRMKKYQANLTLAIKEIHEIFGIAEYKIKEIFKELKSMDENERQKKTIEAFLPALVSGELTVQEISNEYDIDVDVIERYIDKK